MLNYRLNGIDKVEYEIVGKPSKYAYEYASKIKLVT
jgi:hypothetical protein